MLLFTEKFLETISRGLADGFKGAGPSELAIAHGLKGVVALDELPAFSHGFGGRGMPIKNLSNEQKSCRK